MPLLKKMVFEKASVPENLRDDEEVFHCVITNEIFRDYEEFARRIILCNSMVWTCCMTGKTNLTYAEALESEENARKSLKYFAAELRVPVLYLATLTQRTSFPDMAEDVFIYAKDRYFIGENVDACFSGNKWKEYQIQQVIAPTEAEIRSSSKNGDATNHSNPPPSLYKYELLQLNSDDKDISETMILGSNQIRRKKGLYSREKNKLFLKQYAVQDNLGVWIIKDSVLDEFGVKKIKFTDIFDGPLPKFEMSKKIKTALNGKKAKQETLAKFLSQNNVLQNNSNKNNLIEQMRKREEKFKSMKQKMAEEKQAERLKRKEENIKVANYLRDWYKPKEDLELEDHKKLPEFTPVNSKVPAKYFGDVLMITEFVHTFSSLLQAKKYFPNGLTLELMERALTEKEVAGPLMDVLHMLLVALFTVQDAEAAQYKTHLESSTDIKENKKEQVSLTEASYLATVASKFSNTHLGMPLPQLPLYTLTISEILRLHLLSSGARINDTGARWRYQERGGYTSEDDPGLYLRIHEPHIIKALALRNVVELPIGYKIKILSCLTNQLLTYADVRDIVEERLEVARQAKIDLRTAQMAERKREAEFVATRLKIKREAKANSNENVEREIEKLTKEAESKQFANQKKIQELMKKSLSDNPVLLGYDRAFRRYVKVESVPGFFINSEENLAGICLEEPIVHKPELISMDRTEIIKHFRNKYLENDENDEQQPPDKVNGIKTEHNTNYEELLVCSSNPSTCPVHSTNALKTKWSFVHEEEQLDELIDALNKRGIRESELEQVLQNYRENINKAINKTPFTYLNADLQTPEDTEQKNNSKPKRSKYKDTNLGYPTDMDPEEVYHSALTDILLEMEDKIFTNYLGSLKIKDRDTWRDCLNKRNYDEFLHKFNEPMNGKCDEIQKNGDDKSRSSSPEVPLKINKDPGLHLGSSLDVKTIDSDNDENGIVLEQPEHIKKAVECLAIALNQIAQGVEPNNLKKPLGQIGVNKKDKRKADVLPMWEQSLLNSTSFSQIFLHYGTLDSCIKWSRSASKAKCQICRRLIDAENMLLCDGCNNGHHLYCLKPELKSVPSGKWYCDMCKIEMGIEREKIQPPRAAKKKRKLFVIDDDDDDEEDENHDENENESEKKDDGDETYTFPLEENGDNTNSEETSEEESDLENDGDEDMSDDESIDEDAINGNIKEELCHMCGSGGELLNCKSCTEHYHIECVEPPLKRAPRGPWFCNRCKEREMRKSKRDKKRVNGEKPQRSGRFCAARALHKIQDYTKSLQYSSESDDSDEPRRSRREDFPLHNSALQELLSDVMKHDDAWPFIRPVLKTEVPDYYDVISKPMDFGTIKYKLNMGNYKEDSELMDDVVLVFDNCNTYNNSEALVYKCGQRLLKFFKQKCQSLNLKLPKELEDYCDDECVKEGEEAKLQNGEPKAKKQRTQ